MSTISVISCAVALLLCTVPSVFADYCDQHCHNLCCSNSYCCDANYCCYSSSYYYHTTSSAEVIGITFGVIFVVSFLVGLSILVCKSYKRRQNRGQVFSQGSPPQTVPVYPMVQTQPTHPVQSGGYQHPLGFNLPNAPDNPPPAYSEGNHAQRH